MFSRRLTTLHECLHRGFVERFIEEKALWICEAIYRRIRERKGKERKGKDK